MELHLSTMQAALRILRPSPRLCFSRLGRFLNMERLVAFCLLLLLVCLALPAAWSSGDGEFCDEEQFILGEPVEYSRSDAGSIRYLEGSHDDNRGLRQQNVALSFIRMQPKSLLLPHYFDSPIVFYVHAGEALLGWVRGEKTVKKQLTAGDVFSLPAGTVTYILNTDEAKRLHMVGILDTAEALHRGKFQPFFVGGGDNPRVALSGFDSKVLAAAFKVSEEEVVDFLRSQAGGPIIKTSVAGFDEITRSGSPWSIFGGRRYSIASGKKKHKKDEDEKKRKKDEDEEKHKKDEDEEKRKKDEDEEKRKEAEEKHKKDEDDKKEKKRKDEPFNLFEKATFENDYGLVSSTAGAKAGVLTLQRAQVSVTKLKPGSLLAPHWNSGAEIGIVTNGTGTLEVAYANGTNAASEKIQPGTVFYVPQFLPSCKIAARDALEFVSFTVSSPHRREAESAAAEVHFLAGSNSVLKSLDLQALALAFNVPDMLLSSFLNAQKESVILAS